MKKEQRNVWKIIAIILIIIVIFVVIVQYPNKDREIEYYKTCINNCTSEFDKCLDNVTLYNLEQKIQTVPSSPLILSCLWDEDWCVQWCQDFGYEYQKAMGRIK